jgi:hypothetical protein
MATERGLSLALTTIIHWIQLRGGFRKAMEPLRSPGWTVLECRRNLRQNQRSPDLSLSEVYKEGQTVDFLLRRRSREGVLPVGFQGPGQTAA